MFPPSDALIQYESSLEITKGLVEVIVTQKVILDGADRYCNSVRILENEFKAQNLDQKKPMLREIDASLEENLLRFLNQRQVFDFCLPRRSCFFFYCIFELVD